MQENIKIVALSLIKDNKNRFLFDEMHDAYKNLSFLRPVGGKIEFGETSRQAIKREIKEEIGADIESVILLGNFENIFNFNSKPMHEIVYLYEAILKDKSLYLQETFNIQEAAEHRIAKWFKYDDLGKHTIYPPQVLEYI
jgi:ADP-ribose pyrophosphatase YjhB (NUDIX family)